MVGQTVGKYRILSRLGRGGMGTVYKAVDETLHREVAIKCLNPAFADKDILKRFRAEAIALARLNHPNIATLFELTEHDGDLLMVMEFVRGETFDSVSERVGAMPVDRAAQLCVQVLDALAHAHREGIVHRDLKPANLMLTETGVAKVMDFGIARMSGTEHLTNDGFMVGTPAYMSPEQVTGGEIDGRADLYAIGVVFYRLLTGQLPFKADSGIAMAHSQINTAPIPIRQVREELPVECEELLARALAKAPADRYQTAEDFQAALAPLAGAATAVTGRVADLPNPLRSRQVYSNDLTLPPAPSGVMKVDDSVPARAPKPASTSAAKVVTAPEPAPIPAPAAAPSRRVPPAAAALMAIVLLAGVTYAAMTMWRARAANVATPAAPAAGPPVADAAPAKVEPPKPAAPARKVFPPFTFTKVKLLVIDKDQARDRDVSLRFGTDGLQVLDGEKPIPGTSATYRDVLGVFHSHSREPKSAKKDGTPVPLAKVDGGKFSFLKGAPDWITVQTRRGFIPLRVQDGDLSKVIIEIEARTGAKVVRVR